MDMSMTKHYLFIRRECEIDENRIDCCGECPYKEKYPEFGIYPEAKKVYWCRLFDQDLEHEASAKYVLRCLECLEADVL